MLKHVHVSAYSIHRSRAPDTLSLTSTASLSSNSSGTSTTSSTTSSNAGSHEEELSVTSRSRCSSTASLINHRLNFTIPVKIYANVLRSDIEYKTLSVHPHTTSKELIGCVLNKFKMKHRDPNLFYLTIEVGVRKTGLPVRTVMMLDDEAKPVQLQACHPHGYTKLTLQMRRGGLLKVYDSCLMAGSQYKSLLLSERTTVEELIQLLLNCYNLPDRAFKFSLYEVCKVKKCERKLHLDDYPLLVQQQWSVREHYAFYLKRNPTEEGTSRKVPWTRSLDVSGQVNFRLTLRDEVNPRIIHSPTLKPSYNDYENYFYI